MLKNTENHSKHNQKKIFKISFKIHSFYRKYLKFTMYRIEILPLKKVILLKLNIQIVEESMVEVS